MVQVCCEDHKIYDKVLRTLLTAIHTGYYFIFPAELSSPVNICGSDDI